MANSFVRYTGNGSTTAYSVPFSYRAQADVAITIDGVATTAYTWDGAGTTVTFTTAPLNLTSVEIRRTTSQAARLVDYADGSVLKENDLDTDSFQGFYMGQEAIDDANDRIKLDAADFQWTAQSKRIKSVADPTAAQDAVTKNYLESTYLTTATIADIALLSPVASQMALLGVAGVITDMGILGTADVVSDMNILATADVVSDMNVLASADFVSDLNTLASSGIVTDMDLLGTSANVTAMGLLGVSGVITNMGLLGTSAVITDLDLLGTSANVTAMGLLGNSATVTDLGILGTSAIVTDLDLLATSANVTAMGLLGTSANVTAMGLLGNSATITDLGLLGTAAIVTDLDLLATSAVITDMDLLATSANVTAMGVLGTSANVTAMSTVSTNISGVNSFADRYRISSSAPASSLDIGDLYFDTTANELKVYKSSGWAAAGSTVNGTSARYNYTATAAQTTFTGADTAGNTLAYDAGFADVYLNGVRLSAADITITSGTSVVLIAGAAVGDIIDIVGYGTFNVAAVAGSAINSGTINDARLSTNVALIAGTQTLTNKTINGSNNTISNVPNSALVGTGAITINGSAVSLGGSVTVGETKPAITSFTPTTIENTATNVVITGTDFVATPNVEIINSSGVISYPNTITRDSATQITINVTLATDGAYFLRIENPDGNAVRTSSASLIVSDAPTISTGAGTLGTFAKGSAISISLAGTGDATLVWSSTGTLPTGLSLASATGIISGTESSSITAETAYPNIVVTLTDGQSQTTSVTYSITISVGGTGGGGFN